MQEIWSALTAAEKMRTMTDLLGIFLTVLALGFAGYQFMRGVQQYKHEQRWRRKEYVAKEYERLLADPKASLALQMLDWEARSLPLLKDGEGRPITVTVGGQMLGRALMPHTIRGRPAWETEEGAIRDCFDALLDRLDNFETMIAEGLIEYSDLAPYLKYWIQLISDKNSRDRPRAIRNLWLYIDFYNFNRAARLVRRFGRSIKPADGDREQLERECAEGDWSRRGREHANSAQNSNDL